MRGDERGEKVGRQVEQPLNIARERCHEQFFTASRAEEDGGAGIEREPMAMRTAAR